MAIPQGRDWRPGKPGEFDDLLKTMIEEAIEAQRSLTDYKGSDDQWESHVANRNWKVEAYQMIGFNSGFIAASLNIVENMNARLSETLIEKARHYIYNEP